ncbi:unnamed protein product [Zymoseptoria tritici ST99CH_1A5]|uniref:AB hydrolase-1 domain-containing protein n=1 Tax=Zymoseptoria tritici ST99CH_1A5 TaxID=1276529 RepID=A0A1Y6LDZ6_ZYMTR|nr:unnamed protein product [Zymoseptoria tritici ST99CH_1A5]
MGDVVEKLGEITVDKLKPNDDRAKSCYAVLNGKRFHYLDSPAVGPHKGTAFLIHGFPDISLAWRYQIPLLTSLGFRCIALDCMGYGRSQTSNDLRDFGFKAHALAITALCSQLSIPRIIIGGHDWGGMAVYRVAQWCPELVTHVFSVCTAFAQPTSKYTSTETLTNGPVPQFGYQLQFGSDHHRVEKTVRTEKEVRKFLLGMYGGRTPEGRKFMTAEKGVDLGLFDDKFEIAMTPLLSDEELDFYVQEFMRNGMNGPLNWYRTRKVNWEDEQEMPESARKTIKQPTLYIFATKDGILTRELTLGMERHIPNLTRGEVPAGHWALWHTPVQTNALIKDWIEGVVLGGKTKL